MVQKAFILQFKSFMELPYIAIHNLLLEVMHMLQFHIQVGKPSKVSFLLVSCEYSGLNLKVLASILRDCLLFLFFCCLLAFYLLNFFDKPL